MGESRDSGRVPGLGRIMDDGISSGGSRTFGGKSRDPLSFSRSGLIMGDFRDPSTLHTFKLGKASLENSSFST